MKKILILAICFAFGSGLFAQTPQEIINKCITALGGKEAIKKQQKMSAEGIMMIKYGTMEVKGNLKILTDCGKTWKQSNLKFGEREFPVIRAYDGKASWQEMMGNVTDVPPLNDKHDAEHTILLLIDDQSSFKQGKTTEIEGEKVTGIEVTNNNKTTTFFIDMETYLPGEILFEDQYFGRSNQKEMIEKRIRLMDYQRQMGILFPMKTVFYEKGKKGREFLYSKVSFPASIDGSIFTRPDKKKEFNYYEEIID